MNKVIFLVGLPGSGKSHYAEQLAKQERAIILSSDSIRHELFGGSSKQKKTAFLFRKLYERLYKLVERGENVIVDATNIERDKRIKSLQKMRHFSVQKEAHFLNTPYEVCLERNETRKRTVPVHVLRNHHTDLEVPLLGEGFDVVRIIHESSPYNITKEELINVVKSEADYHTLFQTLCKIPAFKAIYRFDQENPYHQFLLCEHTYMLYEYVNEYYAEEDKLVMQLAVLCHDLGKPFTKKFKPLRNAYSYFRHENVSAQLTYHLLTELGFSQDIIEKVVSFVQFHMVINYGDFHEVTQIYHLAGADVQSKLYFFREADRFAK